MRQSENRCKFPADPVILIAALAVAAGSLRRLRQLFRSLEYDEWWTLFNFAPLPVGRILTDLALPNNHPLNTLCVRYLELFGVPELIRLPSLIAGGVVIFLSYRIVRRNYDALTASLTAALTALAVPLIVYSALARGYMLQVMCILIVIEGLETLELKRHRAEILIVAGGIGAMLAVPTGVLLLLPVALGFLILGGEKRKLPGAWIAAGILLIFALCYYLANFSALREGQKWGVPVNSFALYGKFLLERFLAFFPPFLLPWAVCGMIFDRKMRLIVPLSLTVLLLAPVTGAGPARVYMALSAVCAAASAVGATALRQWLHQCVAQKLGMILLLFCGAVSAVQTKPQWYTPDHSAIWRKAVAELPSTALPIVKATAAYPIMCGDYPDANTFFRRRALQSDLAELVMIGEPDGVFNGGDAAHNETTLKTGTAGKCCRIAGTALYRYPLVPVQTMAAGKSCLLIRSGSVAELAEEYGNLEKAGNILRLNEFLSMPVQPGDPRNLAVWLFVPRQNVENAGDGVWELR